MADVILEAKIDTSALRRAIPEIVAFGRRSMVEQCVTSAAIIVLAAQAETPFVLVGQIDSELDVQVTAITATGRPSKAKKPRHHRVDLVKKGQVPLAVLIVMARTNPDSAYSRATGNRWPLSLGELPTGPGSAAARQAIIGRWVSQMVMARHSSTHFIQHGWAGPARQLLSDPNFKGWAARGIRQTRVNRMNQLDPGPLGSAVIDIVGDACVVTAENAIGEASNAVLDASRRQALIEHGAGPLQRAIDAEAMKMAAKLQEYLDRGMKQKFPQL